MKRLWQRFKCWLGYHPYDWRNPRSFVDDCEEFPVAYRCQLCNRVNGQSGNPPHPLGG